MLVEDQEKKKKQTKPIVSGKTINFVKAETVPGASVGKLRTTGMGRHLLINLYLLPLFLERYV